jgi:hypothetical protein
MAFNQAYNTDNVLHRAILIGLLNLLNRNIVIQQVEGPNIETDVREIQVPFFPAFYNNERFMQDFYQLLDPDCYDGHKFAEGGNDPIPRGVIEMTSMAINSAALTNKFVRATYNKEQDGTVVAYSAFLNPIPLTINWDIEIKCSTYLEAMKITQVVIETFYKVAIFAVEYKGIRIPCQVGFSQDYNVEKPMTFTYGEDPQILVKFSLEMEAYQPVFDKPSERFRGNVMNRGIGNTIVQVSGTSGQSGYAFAEFTANPNFRQIEASERPPITNPGIGPGGSMINPVPLGPDVTP